ncbi:MAG: glycosyltransferase [Nitrosopumilales archaeon]|nr:MAG: glycosyltransferase [Nitrosopumilales archaeon]
MKMKQSEYKKYAEVIREYYLQLLNREPDEGGFNYYLNLLKDNSINKEQLKGIIKSSPEFLEFHPEDIPNTIYPDKAGNDLLDLNIVAMYRIKNQERWLEHSLKQTSEICKEIVVLDDGSTDSTLKICKRFPKVVDIYHQEGLCFDETRDKNILLKMALKRHPDFIMVIDGDEVIMPNMKEVLFEDLTILHPDANVFEFRALDMYKNPNQFQINNPTTNYLAKYLFRVKGQPTDLYYSNTSYPGNMHCSHIPQSIGLEKAARSRVKILHYGYYDDELRQAKYNFYKKLDPNNKTFYGYEHLIHPEKFSIPSEYSYLPKGYYIENIRNLYNLN